MSWESAEDMREQDTRWLFRGSLQPCPVVPSGVYVGGCVAPEMGHEVPTLWWVTKGPMTRHPICSADITVGHTGIHGMCHPIVSAHIRVGGCYEHILWREHVHTEVRTIGMCCFEDVSSHALYLDSLSDPFSSHYVFILQGSHVPVGQTPTAQASHPTV